LIVHGVGEVFGGGVWGFLLLLVHCIHTALQRQLAVHGAITASAVPVSQSLLLLLLLLSARRGAAGGRAAAPHFTLLCQRDEICTLRRRG
jgi:hypothetical protein